MESRIRYIVGEKEFEQYVLKPAHGVILDFTASWCPPCKRMGAMFEEKIKSSNGWTIIKMDVDEYQNEEIKKAHGVKGIPALFLYHKGKKIDQFTGASEEKLDGFIKKCTEELNVFSSGGISLGDVPQQEQNIDLQAGKTISVDLNKPQTQIQIRLANGQTTQLSLNSDHTVQHVYDFVKSISSGNFQLFGGFPPKALTEMNQTLEEADLLDSRLNQKLI